MECKPWWSFRECGKLTHGNYPSAQKIIKVIRWDPNSRRSRFRNRGALLYCSGKHSGSEKHDPYRILCYPRCCERKSRPKDQPKYEIQKLGVLGAGMMGAGIAYVSAKAGMDVVLKDVSVEGAEKGKAYSTALLDKAIAKNALLPRRKKRF